jgi:hypothetical protein
VLLTSLAARNARWGADGKFPIIRARVEEMIGNEEDITFNQARDASLLCSLATDAASRNTLALA